MEIEVYLLVRYCEEREHRCAPPSDLGKREEEGGEAKINHVDVDELWPQPEPQPNQLAWPDRRRRRRRRRVGWVGLGLDERSGLAERGEGGPSYSLLRTRICRRERGKTCA